MTDDDLERMNRATWGRHIESGRKKLSLTQAELGLLFTPPVTQTTISRWESGGIEPCIRHKIQMGRIYEIPASILFQLMDVVAA